MNRTKQRLALQLRFVEDFNVSEIATAMRVTEGSVKVYLSRAVQSVRTALCVSFSRGCGVGVQPPSGKADPGAGDRTSG
jgi:predicted RNA polymerase sigma factor